MQGPDVPTSDTRIYQTVGAIAAKYSVTLAHGALYGYCSYADWVVSRH
jgi:hypothetical protein